MFPIQVSKKVKCLLRSESLSSWFVEAESSGGVLLDGNIVLYDYLVSNISLSVGVISCGDRSARLSILFSIIRLDPSERRRRRLLWIGVLFFLVLVILICQLFWVCEPEPKWKDMRSPQCTLNKQVAICQLVCTSMIYIGAIDVLMYWAADVIADLILIIAPLKLLSGLEDVGLRHRLMLIFSTCIVTTIVSLVHAAYILTLGGVKVVIAALVEVDESLFNIAPSHSV